MVVASLLVSTSGVVRAQPADKPPAAATDPREVARALARAGLKLLEAHDYAGAYEQLEAAEARFHAPTNLFWMARAQVGRGKLVAARALYERVLAEPLPPDAPEAFVRAHRGAAEALGELVPRIPTLTVVVVGPAAPRTRVFVDDAPLASADRGRPRAVDPGRHTILLQVPDEAPVVRAVDVLEGKSTRIELSAGAPGPGAPAPSGRARAGSLAPPAVAFGLGGLALGTGIVTGIVALGRVDDLQSRCRGDRCPPDEQSDAARTRRIANISTISFVVAGVATATGLALLWVRGSSGGEARKTGAPAASAPRVWAGSREWP